MLEWNRLKKILDEVHEFSMMNTIITTMNDNVCAMVMRTVCISSAPDTVTTCKRLMTALLTKCAAMLNHNEPVNLYSKVY